MSQTRTYQSRLITNDHMDPIFSSYADLFAQVENAPF